MRGKSCGSPDQAEPTNRTVVLLLTLLTLGLGVYAAGALKQELLPSIDVPRASILSTYPWRFSRRCGGRRIEADRVGGEGR